ncbi:MAG: hypothetical protein IIY60_00375 [Clostridia bacterium]|nr:hypothetical protein [Clostridia bacterium]
MDVNMRKYDRAIIEKDRRYLFCVKNGEPSWHWSLYQAWWDRGNGENARKVARIIGGVVRIFNPITGEVR